jgi:hypothetical protein
MAVDRRSKRLGMLAAVGVLLLGSLGTRLWFLQGVQAAILRWNPEDHPVR